MEKMELQVIDNDGNPVERLTKELMVPLVCGQIIKKQEPTVEDYMLWMDQVTNKTYQLYQKFVNVLVALSLMRAGIRRNNYNSQDVKG